MTPFLRLFIVLIISCLAVTDSTAQFCVTHEYHQRLMETDSNYRKAYELKESLQRAQYENNNAERNFSVGSCNNTLVIPIVVHVMHLGEPIGTGTNISDTQIYAAIDETNKIFSNFYGNTTDLNIQIQLAKRDPNGNPTTGIIRVDASVVPNYQDGIAWNGGCGVENDTLIKCLSHWPTDKYYNIWVINKICPVGTPVAYAYLPPLYNLKYEGTGISYNYMDSGYHVLAHELGHALDMYHTNIGGCANTNCQIDGDRMCDTPPQNGADCGPTNTCNGGGNWDNTRYNVMGGCWPPSVNLARFTPDQATWMRNILVNMRSDLYNNDNLISPTAINEIGVAINADLYQPPCIGYNKVEVKVKNAGANTVSSFTAKVYINSILVRTQFFSANIAPESAINLAIDSIVYVAGQNDIEVELINTNGQNNEVFLDNNTFCYTINYLPVISQSTCIDFQSADDLNEFYRGNKIYRNFEVPNVDASTLIALTPIDSCSFINGYCAKFPTNMAWAFYDTVNSFSVFRNYDLYSSLIDLTNALNANLTFNISHQFPYYRLTDFMELEILVSDNCAGAWTTVYRKNDFSTPYVTPGHTIVPTTDKLFNLPGISSLQGTAFVPQSCTQWRNEVIDLTAYLNQKIHVLFRFKKFDYIASNTGQFIYIDNICYNINACDTLGATILQNGNTLTTGTFTSYQWLFNGAVINGANGPSCNVAANGDYSVVVTSANGCKDTSNIVKIAVGIDENTWVPFSIYPNPTTSGVFIKGINNEKISIDLYDVAGRKLLQKDIATQGVLNQYIGLDGISSGAFMLVIRGVNGYRQTFKIIKTE